MFTVTDATEIAAAPYTNDAAPYVARAELSERNRANAHAGYVESVRGQSVHVEPRRTKTGAEVIAEGVAAYRRAVAFGEGPRGRFLIAVRELEQLGWEAEAESIRAAMRRGFFEAGEPPIMAEIGRALATLERINHSAARGAGLALAEILAGGQRSAA